MNPWARRIFECEYVKCMPFIVYLSKRDIHIQIPFLQLLNYNLKKHYMCKVSIMGNKCLDNF